MGDINIKIKSKDLYLVFAVIVFLIGAGLVLAVWDTGKTVYHSSSDVKVNIAGTDYGLQEAIDQGRIGSGGGSLDCTLEHFYEWDREAKLCPTGYVVTGVGTTQSDVTFTFNSSDNSAGINFTGLNIGEIGYIRCCKII